VIEDRFIVVLREDAGDVAAAADALVQRVQASLEAAGMPAGAAAAAAAANDQPQLDGSADGGSSQPLVRVLRSLGGSNSQGQQSASEQQAAPSTNTSPGSDAAVSASSSSSESDSSSSSLQGFAATGSEALLLEAPPAALEHIRQSGLVSAVFRDRMIVPQGRAFRRSVRSTSVDTNMNTQLNADVTAVDGSQPISEKQQLDDQQHMQTQQTEMSSPAPVQQIADGQQQQPQEQQVQETTDQGEQQQQQQQEQEQEQQQEQQQQQVPDQQQYDGEYYTYDADVQAQQQQGSSRSSTNRAFNLPASGILGEASAPASPMQSLVMVPGPSNSNRPLSRPYRRRRTTPAPSAPSNNDRLEDLERLRLRAPLPSAPVQAPAPAPTPQIPAPTTPAQPRPAAPDAGNWQQQNNPVVEQMARLLRRQDLAAGEQVPPGVKFIEAATADAVPFTGGAMLDSQQQVSAGCDLQLEAAAGVFTCGWF
jgi:hypothetical protein